jgi:hypothetical protein
MTSSQIFISYAEQDTQHARKLYDRLIRENIPVWFEPESLLAGQNRETAIREAIGNCRLFIALLSSDSVRRGEGNKRLVQALDIIDEFPENDIFIIPAKLNNCEPSHAKLKAFQSVDMFPDWVNGFQKIMKSIRKIFPPPPECESDFVRGLFELFHTRQAVILLAQEGRNDMTNTLRNHGEDRFGKQNLLHLVPPPHPVDLKEYFSGLLGNTEIELSVSSPVSFMTAIEKQLDQVRKLFLLITRFEQGNETGNREFAGVLRSLLEKHPNLYILICGGEKLADLYFGGELSLLNVSEARELPCSDFNENQSKDRLKLQQLFTPFKRKPDDRQRLCRFLENEDMGTFVTLDFSDPLIKRLYWKNLLKKSLDGKRIVWRNEVLRGIGWEILECDACSVIMPRNKFQS